MYLPDSRMDRRRRDEAGTHREQQVDVAVQTEST